MMPCFATALALATTSLILTEAGDCIEERFPKVDKPHVLLIVTDDVGWGDISHGTAEYATENIDQLIDTGIELTQFYSHPTCTATRSALLTGQYSFKLGMQDLNTAPEGSTIHIPFDAPTLPEMLKPLGYRTEMLGKWHLGYAAWNMTPTGRGFDNHFGYFLNSRHFYNHTAQSVHLEANDSLLFRGYDMWDNRRAAWEVDGRYNTDLFRERFQSVVSDYNEEETDDPLFMYVAFQTAHTPIQEPPSCSEQCSHIPLGMRRTYCNQMRYMDNAIGEMVALYKEKGLWDDTLLFITTDNGGIPRFSEHFAKVGESVGCNMPYRAGKGTLYEGGVRVWAALNGGDNVLPRSVRGSQSNILSHAIDFTPTVLEGVLGQTLPSKVPFDGLSMWNHLLFPSVVQSKSFRDILYLDIEKNGKFAGVVDGKNKFKFFEGKQCDMANIRMPCIFYNGYYPCDQSAPFERTNAETATQFLFDREKDPYEMSNIAVNNNKLVKKYKNLIKAFVETEGYVAEQDRTTHPEADPDVAANNGTWRPWLANE